MANLANYLYVAAVQDYRFLKTGSANFQGGPLGSLNFFSLIKFSRHLGDNSKNGTATQRFKIKKKTFPLTIFFLSSLLKILMTFLGHASFQIIGY